MLRLPGSVSAAACFEVSNRQRQHNDPGLLAAWGMNMSHFPSNPLKLWTSWGAITQKLRRMSTNPANPPSNLQHLQRPPPDDLMCLHLPPGNPTVVVCLPVLKSCWLQLATIWLARDAVGQRLEQCAPVTNCDKWSSESFEKLDAVPQTLETWELQDVLLGNELQNITGLSTLRSMRSVGFPGQTSLSSVHEIP